MDLSTAERRRNRPIRIRLHNGADRHIETCHTNEKTDDDGQDGHEGVEGLSPPFPDSVAVVVGVVEPEHTGAGDEVLVGKKRIVVDLNLHPVGEPRCEECCRDTDQVVEDRYSHGEHKGNGAHESDQENPHTPANEGVFVKMP